MDDARFTKISESGMSMLHAALSGMAPGRVITYNAYLDDYNADGHPGDTTEVVVLGYQFLGPDGGNYTKSLAILVDESLFGRLRVDEESGRVDGGGVEQPPKVYAPCVYCSKPARVRRKTQFTGPEGIPYCTEHGAQERQHDIDVGADDSIWEDIPE